MKHSVVEAIRDFARAFEFSVSVPGRHKKAQIAYNKLLEVLAEGGRDFLVDTRPLRAHVKRRLQLVFEARKRVPTEAQLAAETGAAVVEWIVKRLDFKVRDGQIKPLSLNYARFKKEHGFPVWPGQKTGELRDAIEAKARVKVTT